MNSVLPRPALSICVPAFNEAANLTPTVRELHAELRTWSQTFEILIIDDGSTDDTGEVAARLAAELPGLRVLRHPVNFGLGGVYRTGFSEAVGQCLSFIPADGQFPPAILREFHPLMATHDLVLGYLPERPCGWLARCLSWSERFLLRCLLGPLPRFQGMMMLRRELLKRLPLESQGRGWMIVMELIIKAMRAGCRIQSLPTSVRPRMSGRSKVRNLRSIASNLWQLLVFAWHLRRAGPPR